MRIVLLLLVVPGILSLLSCSSSENYYMLSPQATTPNGIPSSNVNVGVGPLLIPDYIDRSEIVFQSSPNKFEIPSGHLWAGSLKDRMLTVIATNLSQSLNTTGVRTYPWEPGSSLDYTVAIDIQHFHAQTGGDSVLEATWRLYDEASRKIIFQRHTSLERPLEVDGYEALVAAQSLLLSDFSTEIANNIPR